jgi:hypothetical protein
VHSPFASGPARSPSPARISRRAPLAHPPSLASPSPCTPSPACVSLAAYRTPSPTRVVHSRSLILRRPRFPHPVYTRSSAYLADPLTLTLPARLAYPGCAPPRTISSIDTRSDTAPSSRVPSRTCTACAPQRVCKGWEGWHTGEFGGREQRGAVLAFVSACAPGDGAA